MVKEPKGVPIVKAAVEKIKVWYGMLLPWREWIDDIKLYYVMLARWLLKYKGLTTKISKTQKWISASQYVLWLLLIRPLRWEREGGDVVDHVVSSYAWHTHSFTNIVNLFYPSCIPSHIHTHTHAHTHTHMCLQEAIVQHSLPLVSFSADVKRTKQEIFSYIAKTSPKAKEYICYAYEVPKGQVYISKLVFSQ